MTTQTAPHGTRWGLIIPWGLAALLVMGWCAYWAVLRHETLKALNTWSQTQQQQSGTAGFSSAAVSGFPLRLEVKLKDAAFTSPDGAFAGTTARVFAAVNVVNPAHLIFSLPDPVRYRLNQGAERILTGRAVSASLRTEDRALQRFSVTGEDLRIAAADTPNDTRMSAANIAVHVRPDTRDLANWQVAIQTSNLILATPVVGFERLGPAIKALTIGVVITKAEALASSNVADPLQFWTQAGGQARIETAEIEWGPAQATATGTIHLDEARRLAGDLTVQMADANTLIGALTGGESNPLTAMLVQALDLSQVVFIARDGTLYWQAQTPVGSVSAQPIRALGPVYSPAGG